MTSFHKLNGDVKLSPAQRLTYLGYHFFRGLIGSFSTLSISHFHPTNLPNITKDSPGRLSINSFLTHMAPLIKPKTGLDIIDIGCGSGYIADILEREGITGTYTGIDIFKHPDFLTSKKTPITRDLQIQDIQTSNNLPEVDLVISNTSFEHIKNDQAVASIAKMTTKNNGTQIHIVPSYYSLFIYLWHGYRQYSKKDVMNLFDGQTYTVYGLGGWISSMVHFFFITIPALILRLDKFRQNQLYSKIVIRALYLDKYLPIAPPFYAIVIRNKP